MNKMTAASSAASASARAASAVDRAWWERLPDGSEDERRVRVVLLIHGLRTAVRRLPNFLDDAEVRRALALCDELREKVASLATAAASVAERRVAAAAEWRRWLLSSSR